MDELPPRAKAVLRQAQQHDQCHDDDARRRVREGVARAVGGSAVGGSASDRLRVAPQRVASATHSAPLFGPAGMLTVSAVLVALVASGIVLGRRGAEAPASRATHAPVVVPAPPVAAPAALPGSPSSLVTAAAELGTTAQDKQPLGPRAVASPRAGRRSRASALGSRPATRDPLEAELGLLRRLEEALARRDTHEARHLLAQHRERFPQPVLLEERQGLSALVGCMEHSSHALASSRAFAARYPNSVLTARVLRECEQASR